MTDAELHQWINNERAQRGLPPVKPYEDWLRRLAEKAAQKTLHVPERKFQVNSAARRREAKRGKSA